MADESGGESGGERFRMTLEAIALVLDARVLLGSETAVAIWDAAERIASGNGADFISRDDVVAAWKGLGPHALPSDMEHLS